MAGTITHKWEGTTLVVTSDSGTSSCDLKGAKGDMGVRGAQGAAGLIVGNTILGSGAPDETTGGDVGALYYDTEGKELYFCIEAGVWNTLELKPRGYYLHVAPESISNCYLSIYVNDVAYQNYDGTLPEKIELKANIVNKIQEMDGSSQVYISKTGFGAPDAVAVDYYAEYFTEPVDCDYYFWCYDYYS